MEQSEPTLTDHDDEQQTKRQRISDNDNAQRVSVKEKARLVMTNRNVLVNIASHLRARHLLDLRPTCTQWNSSFIPALRRKHLRIELDEANPQRYNRYTGRPVRDIRQFTKSMASSSTGIPFSNFEVLNCRQILTDFGAVCGPFVTKMDLHCFEAEKWETSSAHRAIFGQMPYLTELTLSLSGAWKSKPKLEPLTPLRSLKQLRYIFYGNGRAPRPNTCARLVSRLIQCATGLERLQLPNPASPRNRKEFRFPDLEYKLFLLATLARIRDFNANIHKLKELRIGEVNRRILEILLEMANRKENQSQLCLETFSVYVTATGGGSAWEEDDENYHSRRRRVIENELKAFLTLQGPKIRDLTFWLAWVCPRVTPIVLPQLKGLRSLAIKREDDILGSRSSSFDLQLPEGDNFPSAFPALRSLEYYVDVTEKAEIELSTRWRQIFHPGVTSLTLDTYVDHMGELGTLFPSVTRLDLHARPKQNSADPLPPSSEPYTRLLGFWPGLRSLKLDLSLTWAHSCVISPDEFLTGVHRAHVPDMSRELNSLVARASAGTGLSEIHSMMTLGSLARKYKTRPGIGDLSRLEEFTLFWRYDPIPEGGSAEAWPWEEAWDQPTDMCVYAGLCLVGPQLRSAKVFCDGIAGNPGTYVSRNAIEFLQSVLSPQAKVVFY